MVDVTKDARSNFPEAAKPCERMDVHLVVISRTSCFGKGENLAPAIETALGQCVVAVGSGELV